MSEIEPESGEIEPTIQCTDIEFSKPLETTKALDTLFKDLDKTTIPMLILGGILLIVFFTLVEWTTVLQPHSKPLNQIIILLLASGTGLALVFGASELIILGVKGIADKLNWSSYFGGIISSFGAALSELVLVIILLIRGKSMGGETGEQLILTAIVLILTTVLINMFFLGLSMIFTTRKGPAKLPYELTFLETNLVSGMMVFSFVLMIYTFTEKLLEIGGEPIHYTFDRVFEGIVGVALVLIYSLFIYFLFRRMMKQRKLYQPHLSEFFQEKEEKDQKKKKEAKRTKQQKKCEPKEEYHQLISFRRFPWIVILVLFLIGVGGVVLGGDVLAEGIEIGAERFGESSILVYAVIVGIVSTSPELIVTFRGLTSKNKQIQEIGLINQISAINQTFFILFGVPFVMAGIVNIEIPNSPEIAIVFGGIFILAQCINSMILDDKAFDLLEGVVVTTLSLVSLIVLMFV
ncbi:MAG: hypothetical protein GF308_09915 [Candidatus Heimdallarchaeota archaeon]|nr:hypothetical protein [Candidatus Heimdallarchaeota archaeon]